MSVDAHLCQRADIQLEFVFSFDGFSQHVVQAVYSFDNKYLSLFQSCYPFAEHFGAVYEIELRQVDFLSVDQVPHLAVEQIKIQRAQTFKVRLAVLTYRSLFSLYKIVISPEVKRFALSLCYCLAQPFGCRGLSAR